ncbi:MAG TPA: outer membrane lipoprotein-sorting protein [Polyangiaceae bacterium]|nr:outer membrane lipoprotein-sorting protein [Polyangiaceae bacterium]
MTAPSAARADAAGDKALATLDANTYLKVKTQYFEYDATIRTPDKADRKLSLSVAMKGDWRLSEFLAPSDVKGTKVLILSPTQMYVYLPAFGKVRRIASHVTDQGFMGMNFTQDDMSIAAYGKMYTATIASDDGKIQKLALTAKPGTDAPYAKLELLVDKANTRLNEVHYLSDTGALLKTETRTGYTCEKDMCTPGELKMVDHTKGGQSTTLVRKVWKLNVDMPDSKFSKRALEGG